MYQKVASGNNKDLRVHFFILIGCMLCIALCSPVCAETYTVCPSGCNFTSIQEAINFASDEDTIEVMAGTYPESIVVNKTLLIIGTGGTAVIGDPDEDVSVTIGADEVTLENLTITPGRVSGVNIQGNNLVLQSLEITGYNPDDPDDAVITGEGLSGITISDCNLEAADGGGITLGNMSQLTIQGCRLENLNIALSFGGTGTPYYGITVINNSVLGHGITVASATSGAITFPEIHDILIQGNTVFEPSGYGIYAGGFMSPSGEYHVFNATIAQNTITRSLSSAPNIAVNAISVGFLRDNIVQESYHGADGISIAELDRFVIEDNTVQECTGNPLWGTSGFHLQTTTNSVVSGNSVINVMPFAFGYAPGPNFLPNLTFDPTNTADGNPVLFYEGENGISIDGQTPAMVVLLSCSDMTISDSTIENSGLGVGIYNCTGITVSESRLLNTNNGIMLIACSDSLIENNTFTGSFFGLGVGDNTDALISGNSFSEYMDSGIVVHTGDSENVMITGNTFTGEMTGLDQAIVTSDANGAGVIIANNNIEHNSRGLLIYFTINTACLNNTIRNSGAGINLNAAQDNVFCNNTVINGEGEYFGIYLFNNVTTGGGLVVNNQFTNNYVLSETPLFVDYGGNPDLIEARVFGPVWGPEIEWEGIPTPGEESDDINIWNVTKTPGPNIVGGPYLGGNYWAKPDGTGWSQVTPDRGDGFCNAPFAYDSNNTDFLPLHLYEGEIEIYAPAVIDQPGHYRLMNDLVNSTADTAISIKCSDVSLNGDGHTLGGSNKWESVGVGAGGEDEVYMNITIQNLTVTGWHFGFACEQVEGTGIYDCQATGNLEGAAVAASTDCTIERCIIRDNVPWEDNGLWQGGSGMSFANSTGSSVLNSTISHNGWGDELPILGGYGILSVYNTGLVVSGCIINENVNTGIWNEDSQDTIVIGNQFSDNGGNGGIFMTAGLEDPVMNCTIADNYISTSEWGIWLIRNDYTVRNNTVTDCAYGILLDSGRDANLSGNVMYDNVMNFGVDGDEIEDYFHEVDTTNTVDGKPVYYLVEEEDVVIDGTSGAGTVYIVACKDIMVEDLVLEMNEYGLFVVASDHIRAHNVTASMNANGISILKSADVYIGECSAQKNARKGFWIRESERVLLVGVDADMNAALTAGTGISVEKCLAVILFDVNACQNYFAGIDVEDTREVYLYSSEIDSNGKVGIILGGDTIMVLGCHVRDNGGPGIGMLDSANITVLNNYFSNDLNIDLSPGIVNGIWNQEKTAGTNIVDGPFIGGNYWANPDGTGWSQVTPDRGDGFCNAPYVIDADNVDKLPLHIITSPPFYADFTGDPVSGYAPLTVQFNDMSSGEPFRWYYRFGDGSTSSSPNAVHTYRSPGTYTVTLSIMKLENSKIYTTVTEKTGYITVTGAPGSELLAQFNARPVTGEAPLTVSFTDYSTGNPTGYRYSFGDLTVSTSANPVHTYSRPGTYSVQLTVWSTAGGKLQSNTTVCQDCITVT